MQYLAETPSGVSYFVVTIIIYIFPDIYCTCWGQYLAFVVGCVTPIGGSASVHEVASVNQLILLTFQIYSLHALSPIADVRRITWKCSLDLYI